MTINLLHVGIGNVGQTLKEQLLAHGTQLSYCGLLTGSQALFAADGLSDEQVAAFPKNADTKLTLEACIAATPLPFILIDTTASDKLLPLHKQALARGGAVVMSNKKPVAGSQADFDELLAFGPEHVYFETTVGAGLPVIETVQSLIATGDKALQIQGCFSGTLGYIFSQLEAGSSFSDAVKQAKAQGFTEPDPRDDLSGTDVARKVLILSRLLGQKLELADIKTTGLYPAAMADLSADEFLDQVNSLDADYAQQAKQAADNGQVLRFVATVAPGNCHVGLEAVPASSDIGTLHGPDNIVVIQTERYRDNPLVIKGPGAGLAVTAGGVFADILKAAQVVGRAERQVA